MKYIYAFLFLALFFACKSEKKEDATSGATNTENASLIYPEEKHFKTMRQVTFGGDNAEAYWSFDDKQIIFQSNNTAWGMECDQMFLMNAEDTFYDSIPPMVSTDLAEPRVLIFYRTISTLYMVLPILEVMSVLRLR